MADGFAGDDVLRILVGRVGGFLRNSDRREGVTCSVCTEPVSPATSLCWQCRNQQESWPRRLADVVAPVTYGGLNRQSRRLLFGYKEPEAQSADDERRALMWLLLGVTNALHRRCIETTVGEPVGAWTVVPSTSGRREHPLPVLARDALGSVGQIVTSAAATQPKDIREVAERRFAFDDTGAVKDRHVLVVDDTWTTGGRAQSLVLSLRDAGASHVSVLVLARWLNPAWQPTERYLAENPHVDFDPRICPVTGGDCPS